MEKYHFFVLINNKNSDRTIQKTYITRYQTSYQQYRKKCAS